MAKNSATDTKKKSTPRLETRGFIALSASLLLLLILITFQIDEPTQNILGLIGWGIGFGMNWAFGLGSYLLILMGGWLGWKWILGNEIPQLTSRSISFGFLFFSFSLLLNLCAEKGIFFAEMCANKIYSESLFLEFPYPHKMTRYNLGGVPIYYLYRDLPTFNLQHLLSDVGIILTFSITGLVSFFLVTQLELSPFLLLLKRIGEKCQTFLDKKEVSTCSPLQSPQAIEEILLKGKAPRPIYSPSQERELPTTPLKKPPVETSISGLSRKQEAIRAQQVVNGDFSTYQIPPASLLKTNKKIDNPSLKKEVKKQAEILEETLLSFGIEAKVGEIHCGPTITSFEVHPAIGVKVQRIKTLENDIALNLQAKSIRIIAPIPGKAAVGVEIPSLYPQAVGFKDLLTTYQQQQKKLFIPLLLGKTVGGDNVISDLAKMPHCLIAGATGSGKSVCINTIIMSILMNARPDEIKLLMIDPKKVELTPYTHLPHLIAPVITEAHGAYAALNWLVKEMQLRYDILKQLGLRNITAFNHRQINTDLEASLSVQIPQKMHGIVAIIDEFADLMMASSSDLETPIARIAQMARAVGIHLILATQRPSREVITGLIKANFPTRIAFKVSSRINSQIILDDVGAESLLGNGDLLFLPPGTSTIMRAQGAYLSDEEISQIVKFICDQTPPQYLIPSFDTMHLAGVQGKEDGGSEDALYEQALSIVIETKVASTTYLQRKLKIGYARAASLMDELERKRVISAQEGAKPRRILIDDQKKPLPSNQKGAAYDQEECIESES